jgi:signal transduction histidine kinase
MKNLVFFLSLYISCLHAQKKEKINYEIDFFFKCLDSISNSKKNEDFLKLTKFYKEELYDSTFVYSSRLLINSKNIDDNDILNYIQGVSAIHKNLYQKALDNFLNVSDDFRFKNLKILKLAYVYLNIKKYNKAISFYLEWEKINGNTSRLYKKLAYHNFGVCYIHVKKYDKAKEYFNKELQLLKPNDSSAIIRTKIDLGNVYYQQYLDKEAIPLFKQAYDLSKLYSNIELKQLTAQNMAVIERNRKHYKESVGYYREFIKWKDSIWSRDRIWELTEKDKKIAVAQKQQEIAVQDEQIKRQKVVQKGLLIGASGLLLFLSGLAFFYRKLQSKNRLITEQKEALNVANNTKNYLFSVVSHDLRSPINSIKRQHQKLAKHIANNDLPAIKEATKSAIAVTESTSHLLNNVLHWSLEQSNMLNFSEEEHALQPVIEQVLFDYENLAEAKAISVTSNLESEIIVLTDKESLKIVIRNLIDNSIKYMDGSGSISVKTEKHSETKARIEIKDSGIGISEEKLQKINALKDLSIDKIDRSKGIGLGLLLCQTLIKKNNGTLFFKSEEGTSTTAVILLPLA